MILDSPNLYGRVSIVLYKSNCWTGPNQKKIVQKSLTEPDKNDLDPSKIIWTVQNHFGPTEGQGISQLLKNWYLLCFQKESNLHYMRCKLKLLDKGKKTEVGSWYSQYFLLLVFLNNNFIPSGTCFSSKMMKIVEMFMFFSAQKSTKHIEVHDNFNFTVFRLY
jgi:hypothetical protein